MAQRQRRHWIIVSLRQKLGRKPTEEEIKQEALLLRSIELAMQSED